MLTMMVNVLTQNDVDRGMTEYYKVLGSSE